MLGACCGPHRLSSPSLPCVWRPYTCKSVITRRAPPALIAASEAIRACACVACAVCQAAHWRAPGLPPSIAPVAAGRQGDLLHSGHRVSNTNSQRAAQLREHKPLALSAALRSRGQ